MSHTTDQIKNKIGIVELIQSYIEVEKAGRNFKAKCPFHHEKTASFHISPERNNYYCFGCGAKGDIFSFVENMEGIDFYGALKILAEKAGIKLESYSGKSKKDNEVLYNSLESATENFEENIMKNPEAIKYLESRGLKKETIEEWRIGYALDEWRDLHDALSSKFPDQVLEKAGLIKKGDKNVYDRFRSRIIFPFLDNAGRVIAFTGRIFGQNDKEEAKYLNSPETEVFNKSEVLFGFYNAKNHLRVKGYTILVEGQMDVILLHQEGYGNTVALSGTALSSEHVGLIRRFSDNLLIAFDSDEAGIKASLKNAVIALREGMNVKITSLPKGEDPAEIIMSDKELWREAVKDSKHLIEFHLDLIIESTEDKRKIGNRVVKELLPHIAALTSNTEKSYFIDLVAKKADLDKLALSKDLESVNIENTKNIGNKPIDQKKKVSFDKLNSIQNRLASLLTWQNSQKTPLIDVEEYKKKIVEILDEESLEKRLSIAKRDQSLSFKLDKLYKEKSDLIRDIDQLLRDLEKEVLLREYKEAVENLELAEHDNDHKKVVEGEERVKNISIKMSKI